MQRQRTLASWRRRSTSGLHLLVVALVLCVCGPPLSADDTLIRLSDAYTALIPGHDRVELTNASGGLYYLIVPRKASLYPENIRTLRNFLYNTVRDPSRLAEATAPTACTIDGSAQDITCCGLNPSIDCIHRLRAMSFPPENVLGNGLLKIGQRASNGFLLVHELARATQLVLATALKTLPADAIYYQWVLGDNAPLVLLSLYVVDPKDPNPKTMLTKIDADLLRRLAATLQELTPYLRADAGQAPKSLGVYQCSGGAITKVAAVPASADLSVGDGRDVGVLTPSGAKPFGPFTVNTAVTKAGWVLWGAKAAGTAPWTPGTDPKDGRSAIAKFFLSLHDKKAPADPSCFPTFGAWDETAGFVNGQSASEFLWSALLLRAIWKGENFDKLEFPAFTLPKK
jgi:hypothetical protein